MESDDDDSDDDDSNDSDDSDDDDNDDNHDIWDDYRPPDLFSLLRKPFADGQTDRQTLL